jgi:hypothetical protein
MRLLVFHASYQTASSNMLDQCSLLYVRSREILTWLLFSIKRRRFETQSREKAKHRLFLDPSRLESKSNSTFGLFASRFDNKTAKNYSRECWMTGASRYVDTETHTTGANLEIVARLKSYSALLRNSQHYTIFDDNHISDDNYFPKTSSRVAYVRIQLSPIQPKLAGLSFQRNLKLVLQH